MTFYKLLDQKTINRKDSLYRIRYYGHIQRRRSDTLLQKAKDFRLTIKRRIGRPRFSFNHTLLHDMQKFPQVTKVEWDRALKEVGDLKKITSTLYAREDLLDDSMDDDLMLYVTDNDSDTDM